MQPVPRAVLVDDVYERLRAWIVDEVRDADVRVNVDAMARMLGVSPTPIREALVRLESDGLVHKEPARGWSVVPPMDADDIAALYEFRLLIEPWGAGRAAVRAGDVGVARLRAELATIPEAPEAGGFDTYRAIAEHDERFHDLVLELAGNAEVRRAFARTHCHVHLFRVTYGSGMGAEALDEHRRIVDAIATGDATGAQGAMVEHLSRSAARLAGRGA